LIKLMPLLGERTVMLTVARINGTPEEVDGGMARSLGVCVENLRLQHALVEAKAEMDAAAKTAREQASGRAGQTAKKTELQGGQQTDSTGTEAPADQENPPLLPACRQPRTNPKEPHVK
jgi:hypothetical protein